MRLLSVCEKFEHSFGGTPREKTFQARMIQCFKADSDEVLIRKAGKQLPASIPIGL